MSIYTFQKLCTIVVLSLLAFGSLESIATHLPTQSATLASMGGVDLSKKIPAHHSNGTTNGTATTTNTSANTGGGVNATANSGTGHPLGPQNNGTLLRQSAKAASQEPGNATNVSTDWGAPKANVTAGTGGSIGTGRA